MNPSQASPATRFRVGVFTLLGLLLIGAVTVYVNDRPYWWRPCDLVQISVEDATGLKTKSPVRSLGLEIGYLKTVELTETHVKLSICITAPVRVLDATRAYIKGEGFLGDKFVELKPVKYVGNEGDGDEPASGAGHGSKLDMPAEVVPEEEREFPPVTRFIQSLFIAEAQADDFNNGEQKRSIAEAAPQSSPSPKPPAKRSTGRNIPVGAQGQDMQHVVEQVDNLVGEMTALTNNLKEAINPQDLRRTMQQLNKTLENASRTLSPEGGLNTTAQRTLAKLEEAIEYLRDQIARINKGEGSLGMILNDPSYAEEMKKVLTGANKLLGKVQEVRFVVDVGAEEIPAFSGGRGYFHLLIYPKPDRYYRIGVSIDPRGKRTVTTTTTTAGNTTTSVQTTQIEEGGILFTIMLGKVLWNRFDLSMGVLHGDGTASLGIKLGPTAMEDLAIFRSDLYTRGQGFKIDDRLSLTVRPFLGHSLLSSLYVSGGFESIRKINDRTGYFYGAGFTFDDEDIKLLFALR